jgi:protein gp37
MSETMRVRSGTFCTRISPGCTNCYASVINKRFGNGLEYTVPNLERVEFFLDDRILSEPIHRQKPARIFVGDMFDLFHEAIPNNFIAEVLRVALKTPRHTFQFLTKRAERMRNLVNRAQEHWGVRFGEHMWFGVSVESQPYADERIPLLLDTSAAVRFLSVEPQLEFVDLWTARYPLPGGGLGGAFNWGKGVSWVICGGESGQQARPMHPDWTRSLRDQCEAAGVPFFFKQWGEWMPHPEPPNPKGSYHGGIFLMPNGRWGNQGDWWEGRAQAMDKVGKKNAGALLDGREWREFPSQKAEALLA